MTKLEKWLVENSSEISKAETTESVYYTVDSMKVRFSDHISKNSGGFVHIIKPINYSGLYTIIHNNRILHYNANETIIFLQTLKVVYKLTLPIQKDPDFDDLTIKDIITKSRLNSDKLKPKFRAIVNREIKIWESEEINKLPNLINKELCSCKQSGNPEFIKFLLNTPCTYLDAINVYKVVIKDNKRVPSYKLFQEAYKLIKK